MQGVVAFRIFVVFCSKVEKDKTDYKMSLDFFFTSYYLKCSY